MLQDILFRNVPYIQIADERRTIVTVSQQFSPCCFDRRIDAWICPARRPERDLPIRRDGSYQLPGRSHGRRFPLPLRASIRIDQAVRVGVRLSFPLFLFHKIGIGEKDLVVNIDVVHYMPPKARKALTFVVGRRIGNLYLVWLPTPHFRPVFVARGGPFLGMGRGGQGRYIDFPGSSLLFPGASVLIERSGLGRAAGAGLGVQVSA